jgi:hypothetical protein
MRTIEYSRMKQSHPLKGNKFTRIKKNKNLLFGDRLNSRSVTRIKYNGGIHAVVSDNFIMEF